MNRTLGSRHSLNPRGTPRGRLERRGEIPRLAIDLAAPELDQDGQEPGRAIGVEARPIGKPEVAAADDTLDRVRRRRDPLVLAPNYADRQLARPPTRPVLHDRPVVRVPANPLTGLGPVAVPVRVAQGTGGVVVVGRLHLVIATDDLLV